MFVSEAADLAGRASERPRGTKNARQIAGRDYEHSSTCQVRSHVFGVVSRPHAGKRTVNAPQVHGWLCACIPERQAFWYLLHRLSPLRASLPGGSHGVLPKVTMYTRHFVNLACPHSRALLSRQQFNMLRRPARL